MHKMLVVAVLLICLLAAVFGCNRKSNELTVAELSAIASISGADAANFEDITDAALSGGRASKFRAVDKVFKSGDLYAFIVSPVAYNGPIKIALVIDGQKDENIGLRIVEHVETPHYVRDMESAWFVGRFAEKSVHEYMTLVRLRANCENEIVAITGATVTTEGVINGVNAAFGVYREFILGEEAGDVPYMVRFEPGQGDGPVETGSLAIRAYGVVLAEVNIEDIRALPSVRRTLSIHSSAGVTQHNFRGTLLSNVLGQVDPGIVEHYRWVLAVGVDSFISGIRMDEVRAENNVYVMYEDNGELLPRKNGEPGAMRIVVLDDFFGQRFTNYLLEIVLENEDAAQ